MTGIDMPLPEPLDYCYEWDGPYGSRKFSAALHNGRPPDRSVAIYSADQLRARDAQWRAIVATEVAKEREQCAKVCEATYQEHKNGRWVTLPQFDGGEDCAAAIRAASPPQCTAPPSEPR